MNECNVVLSFHKAVSVNPYKHFFYKEYGTQIMFTNAVSIYVDNSESSLQLKFHKDLSFFSILHT